MSSGTRRTRQEGASRSRRRTKGVPKVPKAPSHPRGQASQYRIKVVGKEGKRWY